MVAGAGASRSLRSRAGRPGASRPSPSVIPCTGPCWEVISPTRKAAPTTSRLPKTEGEPGSAGEVRRMRERFTARPSCLGVLGGSWPWGRAASITRPTTGAVGRASTPWPTGAWDSDRKRWVGRWARAAGSRGLWLPADQSLRLGDQTLGREPVFLINPLVGRRSAEVIQTDDHAVLSNPAPPRLRRRGLDGDAPRHGRWQYLVPV